MDFDSMTKQQAYDFLVRAGIVRPNERVLEGQEKADMLLILTIMTPTHSTNNQQCITEHYSYNDIKYAITFFDGNEYEITEIAS